MTLACFQLLPQQRSSQARPGDRESGSLRNANTKRSNRGQGVRADPAAELMAERELELPVGGLRDEDAEDRDWERVRPRRVSDADWQRFEGYMREILQAFGMPLDTPGTAKTPCRS